MCSREQEPRRAIRAMRASNPTGWTARSHTAANGGAEGVHASPDGCARPPGERRGRRGAAFAVRYTTHTSHGSHMRGAGAAPPPARAVPSCVEALAPDHGGLAGLGGHAHGWACGCGARALARALAELAAARWRCGLAVGVAGARPAGSSRVYCETEIIF